MIKSTVSLLSTILLFSAASGASAADASPKLKKLSANVYTIEGLGGKAIGLSTVSAKKAKRLIVTLNKASDSKTTLSVWTGRKFRPIATAGAAKRVFTVPARYISNSSRLFYINTKDAGTAFIVDADNKKINKGLVTLFEMQVCVTLRNSTPSTIGYRINGNDMEELAANTAKKFWGRNYNIEDIRQIRITVRVPINKEGKNSATLNFLNPVIGYPRAWGQVGNDTVGFNYDEGEDQTYDADGYRFFIRRDGDDGGKIFQYVISKP